MRKKRLLLVILALLAACGGHAQAQSSSGVIQDAFSIFDAQAASAEAKQVERCKANGSVWIGMGKDVLLACLGRPKRVFTTTTAAGQHEQLVYPGGYVYLDNGIVSALQTIK